MSVTSREVKNKRDKDGNKSGRPGVVYDVNFKYKADDGTFKPYGKRGFYSKSEALKHESEMKSWFAPVPCTNLKVREAGFRNRSFTA